MLNNIGVQTGLPPPVSIPIVPLPTPTPPITITTPIPLPIVPPVPIPIPIPVSVPLTPRTPTPTPAPPSLLPTTRYIKHHVVATPAVSIIRAVPPRLLEIIASSKSTTAAPFAGPELRIVGPSAVVETCDGL